MPANLFRCPSCGQDVEIDDRYLEREDDEDDEEEDDYPPWDRRETRRDSESHRGPTLLTLGIVSLSLSPLALLSASCFCLPGGLIIGLPGLIMSIGVAIVALKDLRKMKRNEMDPRGHGLTLAGWIFALVGLILNLLAIGVNLTTVILFWSMQAGMAPAPPPPAPIMTPMPVPEKPPDEQDLPMPGAPGGPPGPMRELPGPPPPDPAPNKPID
jgi:hypothetical protein